MHDDVCLETWKYYAAANLHVFLFVLSEESCSLLICNFTISTPKSRSSCHCFQCKIMCKEVRCFHATEVQLFWRQCDLVETSQKIYCFSLIMSKIKGGFLDHLTSGRNQVACCFLRKYRDEEGIQVQCFGYVCTILMVFVLFSEIWIYILLFSLFFSTWNKILKNGNYVFLSHNSDFRPCNCEFISKNSDFPCQNFVL